MDNKMVGLILALAVGVIMTGALLAPVISAYGEEQLTYYNEGVPYAEFDGEEHSIVVAISSGGVMSITTDGTASELPDFSLFGSATIVYADDGLVRLGSNGAIRAFDSTGMAVYYDLSAGESATIAVSDSGVSVVYGESTDTASFTPTAYIGAGDYVLSTSPCVSEDSVIIAGVTDYESTDYIVFTASGSIDDLTSAAVYAHINGATATVTSVTSTVNNTALNPNLYRIDSVVFSALISSETYTGTYSYFLAPHEVVYDNSNYIGFGTSGLMAAIVVVVLVALVAAAAAAANRDRDL